MTSFFSRASQTSRSTPSVARRAAWGLAMVTALLPSWAFAQDHGTQPGTLNTQLQPGQTCFECHAGLRTRDGRPYMAYDTWATSMMANATRDPLFLATMSVAEQDAPGSRALCLRCHSPTAHTNGHARTGMLNPDVGDTDGINCDACHRSIVPTTDPMAPYVSNGQLFFADAPVGIDATRYGPRFDPSTSPRHPTAGSSFIRDSRMCGQCHDLTHPSLNRRSLTGEDLGYRLPVQTTYSEWAQSDYARRATPETCQTCHMPLVDTMRTYQAARTVDAPLREGQRRHDFFGANAWGMDLLRAALPGERDEEFIAARMGIQAFVRNAASVAVTGAPAEGRAGESVRFTARVTNLTGHKLPTGYEDSRVMWVQVLVDGRVVYGA